ncbi:MAG: hypothetical protein KA105_00910 [Caulobacter sp.]|nr:hypothetical protein [Caulobacter sp.]
MRRVGELIVLATLFVATGAAAEERGEAGMCPVSRAAYTAELPDAAWDPRTSALPAHEALRSRLGATLPTGATRLLIHTSARHHTLFETSTVAVRGADGVWRVDRVAEESSGLLTIEPKADPAKRWTLPAADGKALDAILADPCFYSEPDFYFDRAQIGHGMAIIDLETASPGHSRLAVQAGVRAGLTGQAIDLILKGAH